MVAAVREVLSCIGVDDDDIRNEDFLLLLNFRERAARRFHLIE